MLRFSNMNPINLVLRRRKKNMEKHYHVVVFDTLVYFAQMTLLHGKRH